MARTKQNDTCEGNIADRILHTLRIADRRGYGLSIDHLSKILVRGDVPEEEIIKEISAIPGVSHQEGIYCLKGKEALIPETRRRLLSNGEMSEKYGTISNRFASEYASACPFIRCIAIAGSVASGGFSEEDDIDFNIFVERGYRYTAYLFGIFLSIKYSFRYRRKPLSKRASTPLLPKLICINVIWEEVEVLPYARQDEYLAYELLRQKPVYGLGFYSRILEENRWLESYFPQMYKNGMCEVEVRKTFFRRSLKLFFSNKKVSCILERVCREVSYRVWRFVQFSRRNNPEALERVSRVTEIQRPYALFGDRI